MPSAGRPMELPAAMRTTMEAEATPAMPLERITSTPTMRSRAGSEVSAP